MVTMLVPFYSFINAPLARYGNCLYNLPFNMNTFYQIWGCMTPNEAITILKTQQKKALDDQINEGHFEPSNLEEQALRLVGKDIYELLIKGYTEKQWGRKCVDLPSFIIKRIPIRTTFDNNYYNDRFQGIPEGGYNKLIAELLKDSDVILNCDYITHRNTLNDKAKTVVYSGPIDEYFDFAFGQLDYRSIWLENETKETTNWQGNAVINYTDSSTPFTRSIEHRHFEPTLITPNPISIISREYSTEWRSGLERCYPVNDLKNNSIYSKYKDMAIYEKNVIFGGRLAEYKYYDMDDTIAKALLDANEYCKNIQVHK